MCFFCCSEPCGLARAAFSLKNPTFLVLAASGREAGDSPGGHSWVLERGMLRHYSPPAAFEEEEEPEWMFQPLRGCSSPTCTCGLCKKKGFTGRSAQAGG